MDGDREDGRKEVCNFRELEQPRREMCLGVAIS